MGLLLGMRRPQQQLVLIGVAALISAIHAGNHLYDDLFAGRVASPLWLTNTLPLLALTLILGQPGSGCGANRRRAPASRSSA